MKYCNKCGNETKGNEKFCRKCGAKLSAYKEETKKEERKEKHERVHTPKKTWKTYTLYTFLVVLVLSLAFTSYQYYYYFKEYNNYYSKFKYEESEKDRYINLFNTEKQNKESEITKRRQAESQLSDAQATIQAKSTEISGLRDTLTEEQRTRTGLQSQLSETEQALGTQSQELQTVKREVDDVINTINSLETFVKSSSTLPDNILTKIHGLCSSPIQVSGGNCIINANKMGSDMTGCIDFTWVDDQTTSNFADGQRIFDVNTFWQSKEGDCDDFGFFMAAWLRAEYEIAKSTCGASNVLIQIKPGSLFSNPTYVTCPCDFYAIGGHITKWGGGYHMETGISAASNLNPSNIYIIEPQGGGYDYIGDGNVMDDVIWLFTKDDFLIFNNGQISNSISRIKSKAGSLK